MPRFKLAFSLAVASMLVLATTAVAAPATVFPGVIPLPNGFRPEGIAAGYGADFYVGSLASGAIFKGDLRTGAGALLVPGQPGRIAVGLSFDKRSAYLFVAGGPTGAGYVYDTRTGETAATFQFSASGSFVNDVIVTRSAAYFTDSFQPALYKVPLSAQGGLPEAGAVEVLPLSGDWAQTPGFNANGIEATATGKALIVVNSSLGTLYRVDPQTGAAALIDLGGASVTSGDGLLLENRTLYVVRNFLNQIAVIDLAPDLSSGAVVATLTDPDFRIPTTVAGFGPWLYAVNARFDVPAPGPDTQYEVVQASKR